MTGGAGERVLPARVRRLEGSAIAPDDSGGGAAPVGRGTLRTISVLWGHPTNIEATGNPS